MAYSYRFADLKNSYSHEFGTQKKAACGIIEYIFNQSNADDLKEIIFNYYQTEAFDASGTTLQFNGKKYKVKDTCWKKEKFWVFQILVCYNINEIINNRKSIKNYSDLEQYRNNKFWIESASKTLDEDQISAQRDAVGIVCSWPEIPVKHQKKLRCTVPSQEFTSGSGKTETGNISIQEIKDARYKMAFCDEAIVSTSDIVDVLAGENGFFPSEEMKKILTERYEKMRKNHLKTDWTDLDWTQHDPRPNSEGLKIVPQNNDYDAALLQVPGKYCYQTGTGDWKETLFKEYNNIGHDMPVWLYYQNDPQNRPLSQRPRVMIVSQDPLRSGYGINDILLLSTPWAHHSLKFLENCSESLGAARTLATEVIHRYLKKGAVVYLTDVRKLYFGSGEKTLKNLLDAQDMLATDLVKKIEDQGEVYLEKEVSIFMKNNMIPKMIVALGNVASRLLTGHTTLNAVYSVRDKKIYSKKTREKLTILEQLGFNGIVYTKCHTNARPQDKPCGNDPDYWLREGPKPSDNFVI